MHSAAPPGLLPRLDSLLVGARNPPAPGGHGMLLPLYVHITQPAQALNDPRPALPGPSLVQPDGSLLLISPVAPTGEALSQLAAIGGEVSHIVLPSSSPEHW